MSDNLKLGIHNVDCLEGMKDIPDGAVQLVATDPPYGISYVTNHRKYDDNDIARPVEKDDKFDESWFTKVISECYRILDDNTHIYVFGSDVVIGDMKKVIEKFFTFKNTLVWDKRNWSAGDLAGQYGKQAEFIIFAQKGRRPLKRGRPSSVISIPRIPPEDMVHSCQKPLSLMAWMIENSTDRGEVVCDPFVGSGTTAIAAEGGGRQFVGFEMDPKTYRVALKRMGDERAQLRLF